MNHISSLWQLVENQWKPGFLQTHNLWKWHGIVSKNLTKHFCMLLRRAQTSKITTKLWKLISSFPSSKLSILFLTCCKSDQVISEHNWAAKSENLLTVSTRRSSLPRTVDAQTHREYKKIWNTEVTYEDTFFPISFKRQLINVTKTVTFMKQSSRI